MSGRIAIMSTGLWRMRGDVETLTGLTPVFRPAGLAMSGIEAIAGWGHKPTAARARKIAARRGLPYVAIEDGFLRSVRPGPDEPPQSLILDRTGIYYDARTSCDLEQLLNNKSALDSDEQKHASHAIQLLKTARLSKYNDAPPFPTETGQQSAAGSSPRILVIDQTLGDASIAGALGDESSFGHMLQAAISENPGARIIVKLHPETLLGSKPGYLTDRMDHPDVEILTEAANPWLLFENVVRVYTVSSQLGFEALMAGCQVVCFGVPFYAGWGLTDDRQPITRRTNHLSIDQLVHTVFFEYCRYLCTWTRQPIDFATAIDQLAFRRDHFHAQSRKAVCSGITAWKRPVVRAMLTGRAGPPLFTRRPPAARLLASQHQAAIAAWGRKASEFADTGGDAVNTITIEDGFLRSVGLGAGFVQPVSLVFDPTGIYYDPGKPSDLESILQNGRFDQQELNRARALRQLIIASQLTKYNLPPDSALPDLPGNKQIILVPGQVADDESVRLGAAELCRQEALADGGANLALLKAVRQRNRDAFIIYKPHPDVEAGLRAGRIGRQTMASLADHVFEGTGITPLFAHITSLETATSLAGFEAILREIPVVTHGTPFYAGWGLTQDLAPCARRTKHRSLDELAAACLMRYPVYVAPGTRHVCPADMAAQLLAAERDKLPTIASRTQSLVKKSFAKLRYTTINLFGKRSGPRV